MEWEEVTACVLMSVCVCTAVYLCSRMLRYEAWAVEVPDNALDWASSGSDDDEIEVELREARPSGRAFVARRRSWP